MCCLPIYVAFRETVEPGSTVTRGEKLPWQVSPTSLAILESFREMLPSEKCCLRATPARCGHSGRYRASNHPVLCVGGGLGGLTAVATRAHE